MYQFCDPHTEPAEEAGDCHTFHHDHHTGDKENGLPVDAGGSAGTVSSVIPEIRCENTADIQRLQHCGRAVHAESKDYN